MDEARANNDPIEEPPAQGDQMSTDLEGDNADEEPSSPAGEEQAPTGGDATTESQLDADNAVEEDMIRALDPGAPTG